MRKLLTVLFLLSIPLTSQAATKPRELAKAIQANQPIGEATLRKFFIHVYDATFWSDSGDWSRAPYALSITYAMNVSGGELADRTRDEMKHVSDLPAATLGRYTERLRALYPDINEGDRITALQKNASTTVFFHNGKKIGQIDDAGFAMPFFSIWLSPKSSEPEMQRQLLP